MTVALASDASRRNMTRQATRITLVMRHGANLLVCAVALAIPPLPHELTGRVIAAALGLWSAYRLGTRKPTWRALLIDYATTFHNAARGVRALLHRRRLSMVECRQPH
ncbi:hypothetical protein [Mycolicibacterium llatzerense]|uniref:hypothetical protein n=1 Tax=Mycolicibacterium llatzerense TaxID=280871 RepID=UPI0013A69A11|nr:hypothetical protein [Mycolicibacterium llatzerense]